MEKSMQQEVYSPFQLETSWQKELSDELTKPYIYELSSFVEMERAMGRVVYPPRELVFNAFNMTPYAKARVVIVGQDPYHGAGQAHGLSFSVPRGVPLPPSLQNIFKELATDLGVKTPSHGCLLSWADQGVLLLNATLTVRQGEPMSHHKRGWEQFTDGVIAAICKKREPVIFLLWGKSAQEKCHYFRSAANQHHHFLTAPHPSPFSAHQGFFGCRHFSKTNALLVAQGHPPINWDIELARG
jgi:uracil-DNA glycosylase